MFFTHPFWNNFSAQNELLQHQESVDHVDGQTVFSAFLKLIFLVEPSHVFAKNAFCYLFGVDGEYFGATVGEILNMCAAFITQF
jgi:hypothetical protein